MQKRLRELNTEQEKLRDAHQLNDRTVEVGRIAQIDACVCVRVCVEVQCVHRAFWVTGGSCSEWVDGWMDERMNDCLNDCMNECARTGRRRWSGRKK